MGYLIVVLMVTAGTVWGIRRRQRENDAFMQSGLMPSEVAELKDSSAEPAAPAPESTLPLVVPAPAAPPPAVPSPVTPQPAAPQPAAPQPAAPQFVPPKVETGESLSGEAVEAEDKGELRVTARGLPFDDVHRRLLFALQGVFGGRYTILVNLPLSEVARAVNDEQAAKLRQEKFDFALCDPDTLSLIAGVQLDLGPNTAHSLVSRVCEQMQWRCFVLPVQNHYAPQDIEEGLAALLDSASVTVPAASMAPPACPRCAGATALRRVTTQGEKRQVWLCERYPDCKGVLAYETDET